LTDGTGGGFVGCVILGAMRPVESGKENGPANKQQEQHDARGSGQSLDHTLQPIGTVLRMPPTKKAVKAIMEPFSILGESITP